MLGGTEAELVDQPAAASDQPRPFPTPPPGPDASDPQWEVYGINKAAHELDESRRLYDAGVVGADDVEEKVHALNVELHGEV